MPKPKILILGHGRHGKDTVAELLQFYTGLTFASSSYTAAEVILPALNAALGNSTGHKKYCSVEAAFEGRHNHRMLWKELISLYTATDKSALVKLVLADSDVYVGMRCNLEYEASKHLFDHVIWVDASNRHSTDPSMDICWDDAMIYIDNYGTLGQLRGQMMDLVLEMRWDRL